MDFYLGQIVVFPYYFTPQGFVPCDGRTMAIKGNEPLFTVIGNAFGGDGTTSFKIPDYASIAPPGSKYYIATTGFYPQRS